MRAMVRTSLRPVLRLTAVLAAAMLAAVVVWQAPHIVHHFFDRDHVEPQHECVFAANAERGLSTAAEVVTFLAVHDIAVSAVVATPPLLPEPPARPEVARAPPALCS
jgi:hypothetical protein